MTKPMTDGQIRRFMGTGSKTGKLATVCEDGRPHVAAIWFDFDEEGNAIFLTWGESVKARNMRRDPRASLLVDDEEMPFSWARIDGTVELDVEPERKLHWATETCRRYVGDELAESYGSRNAVPGEIVVRLTPAHLVGETDLAE